MDKIEIVCTLQDVVYNCIPVFKFAELPQSAQWHTHAYQNAAEPLDIYMTPSRVYYTLINQ